MRILITAPSLDENINVSGISTIVSHIIDRSSHEYVHFVAGRADGEGTGPIWLLRQVVLPLQFFARIIFSRIELVHINTALSKLAILRDCVLTWTAKIARRKVVLAIHGCRLLLDEYESRFFERLTRMMLGSADVIVVYSEFERSEIAVRWPHLDIRILPNAVPMDSIPTSSRDSEVPVIVFLGRLHESKGLHEITTACELLVKEGFDFEIRAYGEGLLKEFFIAEMNNVLGDNFHFGGVVSGSAKWDVLGAADIFVLPSRYGEGLPMAILEAMAVGCIVVAADVASVTSVLTDGVNGYVIKPYDAQDLAEKLKSLLKDKQKWEVVRENAISTIRDHYDMPQYLAALDKIYDSALDRKQLKASEAISK